MRGNTGPWLLLLAFLGLFGGFAWLTRHPEAEIVQRAEQWPFVGPLASKFRDSYTARQRSSALRRTTAPPSASAPAAPAVPELAEPVVPPIGDGSVWVLPGTVMRRQAAETSPKIMQFGAIANVLKLERRGDWYHVWFRGQEGWVLLQGYSEDEPPYGSGAEPPKPLPSRRPDEETLDAARRFLSAGGRGAALGPYMLYTDSGDEDLLRHLGRVADALEAAYVQRYGLRPVDARPLHEPREVVVLYAEAASYLRLKERSDRLAGVTASGHAVPGMAVLFAGDRPRWQVAATLIHELAHTINRRALGPALPSWLEEGIADDLASSAVDENGRIELGSLGGERRLTGERITMHGGVASLWKLRELLRGGRLLHVRELLGLEWETFVRDDLVAVHYAAAAFWVRFLLDGEDARYASRFRDYLRAVAAGGSVDPKALREKLGERWSVLDARYRLWLDFYDTPVSLSESSPVP